jgi:hypothetical protein
VLDASAHQMCRHGSSPTQKLAKKKKTC